MKRQDFIASQVARDMFGLEIGPGYAPSFRKSDGWNVETLDHMDADGLREKYKDVTDPASIEEVNYVSDGRAIEDVIALRGEYDFIYASHVIEHITDPIRFFKSCEKLLKPSGKLVLVVPDKRRCFDALRFLTSTGDFIGPYRDVLRRHTAGNAFDFYANVANFDGHGIWESDWRGKMSFSQSLDHACDRFRESEESGDYTDIHAWRFTPHSFRLILKDLVDIGMIALRETAFHPTEHFEFYFAASIYGSGCKMSRMDLHEIIAQEQIAGFEQIFTK